MKELESWTDTLTTALRRGAHLKGMSGKLFAYLDSVGVTVDESDGSSSLYSNSDCEGLNGNMCKLDRSSILKGSKRKSNIVPPSPPRRK